MSTINKGGYDSPTNVSPVAPARHIHNAAAVAAVPVGTLTQSSDAILPHLPRQPDDEEAEDYIPDDIREQFKTLSKAPDFDDDPTNPNLYFGGAL